MIVAISFKMCTKRYGCTIATLHNTFVSVIGFITGFGGFTSVFGVG